MEKLETLIGKLCSGTSVAQSDFQNGYGYGHSFSSYNTDFFTMWEISGYYRFSWSERHPSTRFTMDTRSEAFASYVLITQLGALRRANLRLRPIVLPSDPPTDGRWRITDTPWPRVKRYTHATYPILSVEAANSRELRQILFATRFSREDLLNSFMKQDGQPVLSPWMTSTNSAYLERLREATVDLRYIASR